MQHKSFITAIAALGLLCACGEKQSAIEFERPAEVYFTDSILVYPAGSISADSITGEQLDTDIIGLVNMKAADGHIARIIRLPEALVNIAFDSSTGTLYGFDIDDHIYRYRL